MGKRKKKPEAVATEAQVEPVAVVEVASPLPAAVVEAPPPAPAVAADDPYPYIEQALQLFAVPIASIILDPANPRSHPQRSLDAIGDSVRAFKQQKPIVLDADGIVRKGNGTATTMRELGYSHIAAVRSTLRGEEAIAYSIADNKSGDLAEWNYSMLGESVRGLDEALAAATGLEDYEIAAFKQSEWVPPAITDLAPTGGGGGGSGEAGDGDAALVKLDRDLTGTVGQWRTIDAAIKKMKEQQQRKIGPGTALAAICATFRGLGGEA